MSEDYRAWLEKGTEASKVDTLRLLTAVFAAESRTQPATICVWDGVLDSNRVEDEAPQRQPFSKAGKQYLSPIRVAISRQSPHKAVHQRTASPRHQRAL